VAARSRGVGFLTDQEPPIEVDQDDRDHGQQYADQDRSDGVRDR